MILHRPSIMEFMIRCVSFRTTIFQVFELDLSDPSKIDASNSLVDLGVWKDLVCVAGPSFVKQIDELDRAGSRSSSLSLETDAIPAIKMQLNTGGGSFPWHYDNPGQPNKRILTCVVYLNPKWKEGDGGEIVLCPFLSQRIVIPPLHRRAVLFFSDRVLHRVLPSNERRMCFTIWCNGKDVNARKDVVLSKDQLQFRSYDEAQIFFAKSPLQRVISRAVYSDEYLESLLECLASKNNNMRRDGDSEGLTKEERSTIIKQHEMNVLGITSKLRPLIEEFRKRKDNFF
ncbi:hypothetical protein ACHAWF_001866 [Thalassiosira exigua]